jgi:hypothetical protein
MPRGDRTGPLGEGPMTGRQLGYGAGYDSPGYTRGPGRGWGRGIYGRGRGRGFFWAKRAFAQEFLPKTPIMSVELSAIKSEVQDLKNNLASVLDRLNMLAAQKEKK